MSDIVERLRDFVVDEPNYGKGLRMSIGPEDVEEAADEIERLRAALRWYADKTNWNSADVWGGVPDAYVDEGDKARAALGEKA